MAGAGSGTPTSPMPPRFPSPLGTIRTVIGGVSRIRRTRVFEKFRRLQDPSDRSPNASQGVGLGLAIAKGFVEAMGGRIAAASPIHDGKGTRMLISLPKGVATPHHLL